MSDRTTSNSAKNPAISLDTWAVLVAFALALAVKFGFFARVPW